MTIWGSCFLFPRKIHNTWTFCDRPSYQQSFMGLLLKFGAARSTKYFQNTPVMSFFNTLACINPSENTDVYGNIYCKYCWKCYTHRSATQSLSFMFVLLTSVAFLKSVKNTLTIGKSYSGSQVVRFLIKVKYDDKLYLDCFIYLPKKNSVHMYNHQRNIIKQKRYLSDLPN